MKKVLIFLSFLFLSSFVIGQSFKQRVQDNVLWWGNFEEFLSQVNMQEVPSEKQPLSFQILSERLDNYQIYERYDKSVMAHEQVLNQVIQVVNTDPETLEGKQYREGDNLWLSYKDDTFSIIAVVWFPDRKQWKCFLISLQEIGLWSIGDKIFSP